MKQLIQIAFSLTVLAIGALPASACCLWPFGGMWGAGYYGTPVSTGYYGSPGYYSSGYGAWSTPSYGSYYSAGYASTGGCCVPSCCDPCGGACASGSCAESTSSGTLKPETDQNFGKGSTDPTYDRDRTLPGATDPVDDSLERDLPLRSRRKTEDPLPEDSFSNPVGSRRDPATEAEPFGTGTDQINNKPPMSDIQDPAAADPAAAPATDPAGTDDKKTFLPPITEETPGASQTRRDSRPQSLAEQSSGLSEVIRSKRLASRSLPAIHRAQPATSYAGRSDGDNAGFNPPVRWISVPMPEGNVRL